MGTPVSGMIQVFVIQKNVNSYESERTVHLTKDGVTMELTDEDMKELNAVLNGKRKIFYASPEEGEYISPYIFLHNKD